jgi:UV DNA damage endonuclease
MWSTKHLYNYIYKEVGVPIVFDYHHHRFCTGGQSEKEALTLAVSTWTDDVTPVVHLSESRAKEQNDEKIRPQAHSDFLQNPVKNYGHRYDMMLECKKKELALLKYRKIINEENQARQHSQKNQPLQSFISS